MTNIFISCLFNPVNRVTRWQRKMLLLPLLLATLIWRRVESVKNSTIVFIYLANHATQSKPLTHRHTLSPCRHFAMSQLPLDTVIQVQGSVFPFAILPIAKSALCLARCSTKKTKKKITIIVIYAYLNIKCVNWQPTSERQRVSHRTKLRMRNV